MNWWQGVVLGIVQGLTEFLPISSSGHLVVAEAVVGLTTPGVFVEVVLHVATLLAVVFVYRARLWHLLVHASRGAAEAWQYIGLLVVGTLPIVVVGLLFREWVERLFDSLFAVGLNFLLTAMILWSVRWARRGSGREPTGPGAAGIGIAQAFALLPGISRSGSTVTAALWLGLDPVAAAEFSFLLSIPAILGAAVLQIPKLGTEAVVVTPGPLAASFVAALVSGIVAIRLLVALLRRGTFHRFAPYCLVAGLFTLTWWIGQR